MAGKKERMSLFGGLLAEGLDASLRTFQAMTRDEQINAIQKGAEELTKKLNEVNAMMQSIRNDKIRMSWQVIWNEYHETVQEIIQEAYGDPIRAFFELILAPFRFMFAINETIWGTFYGWMLNLFWPKGPVSFEEAQMNAIEFFTIAGDFNVLASVFDMIGHIEILGTKLPGNAVAFFIRNISWTFGIGWLTWVVMGPVLRHSIADPYDKAVRQITRPADFTVSQIEDFYEHGIAQLEEFTERLVELGYADDKILMLYELMKKRVLREEARRYVTDVANAFVKGYVSAETLWQAITLAYWTDDERKFRMMEENVRKTVEIIDTRVKEIERAFKNGKITEEEATARLSEYIVDPEMVEAYIALWKQYINPEEVVDPAERLQLRKRRLEIRISGLNEQIAYLQQYLQERLELYDMMIKEVENRYNARIQRLRAVYEARISAVQNEFAAWKDRTLTEIEERLKVLEYELGRFIQVHMADITGNLEKISDETLRAAGLTRDVILNTYIQGDFDTLLNQLTMLAIYIKAGEKTAVDQMLSVVDAYFDLLARYQLLQSIATVRIEEREARVNAMITRLQAELNARINELQSNMADEKERIEKQKEIEKTRTEMRISNLKTKVDEYSVELASIQKQIEAIGVGG